MALRHLVIGSGNMGRRHGTILNGLGDSIVYVDIGFTGSKYNFTRIDSILICTPPQTHVPVIRQLGKYLDKPIPLFVEKPVITRLDHAAVLWHGLSMVACNWRYCHCYADELPDDIFMAYPGGNYAELDLIHFFDWFWWRKRKPVLRYFDKTKTHIEAIIGSHSEDDLRVNFEYTAGSVPTLLNSRIHRDCGMFKRQMQDWRLQVMGKNGSTNSIQTAAKRTAHLIESIKSYQL